MRDRVVFIPYVRNRNQCNENEWNKQCILKKHFQIDRQLTDPLDFITMLNTKAVIMGWTEEYLDNLIKLRIDAYKLCGAKIIWTLHNKMPHDKPNSENIKKNMLWLANKSDRIIVHSESSAQFIPGVKNLKKAFFLPQIEYSFHPQIKYTSKVSKSLGISSDDFVFLCFGNIRRYKHIEASIKAFNDLKLEKAKLLIAGRPLDREYAKELKEISENNKSIIFDYSFISNSLLECLLDISDVVILSYKTETSINSGAMIHAFSAGKPVIISDICCAQDLEGKEYLYMHSGTAIKEKMLSVYNLGKKRIVEVGKMAQDDVRKNNSIEVVERKIIQMIG